MPNDNNCTVIVCSCDKYSDLWRPYFELFKKFWKDCPYKVILNTETLDYSDDELDLQVFHPEKGREAWSTRLCDILNSISSEFVLLTLDDHYLLKNVDEKRFFELISYMKNHQKIAQMSFLTDTKGKGRLLDGVWVEQKGSVLLRVKASTALWRRDRLLALLKEGESAWEFEGGASRRSRFDGYRYYAYKGSPDWPEPIIDYAQHVNRGYGVFQGRWLWKNGDFFKENGINVDLSCRGVWGEEEFYEQRRKNIEKASKDWRDSPSLRGNIYRHTPEFILKIGSRIKRMFIKQINEK